MKNRLTIKKKINLKTLKQWLDDYCLSDVNDSKELNKAIFQTFSKMSVKETCAVLHLTTRAFSGGYRKANEDSSI